MQGNAEIYNQLMNGQQMEQLLQTGLNAPRRPNDPRAYGPSRDQLPGGMTQSEVAVMDTSSPGSVPPQAPSQMFTAPSPPPPGSKAPSGSHSGAIPMIDRSDYDELVGRLNEKGVNSLNQQQKGLDDQKSQILMALEHQDNKLDLSPLMALVDTWTGGNVSKGYSRPDYEQGNDTTRQLEAALQKGRNDMSGREVDLLKSQLGIESDRLSAQERSADRREAAKRHADSMALQRQTREDNLIERDVQKLGGVVGDTAPLVGKMQQVDSLLQKYGKGLDIPGIGATDAWKPDLFVSEDGTNLRQVVAGIQSDVIRMYSGTAASEGEVRRIANGLGSRLTQGDEQFRYGMTELNQAIARAQAEKEARFRPEVRDTYRGRGGVDSRDLGGLKFGEQPQAAPAQGLQVGQEDEGHVYLGGDPSKPESWRMK